MTMALLDPGRSTSTFQMIPSGDLKFLIIAWSVVR
jgi:hypothetical protein